MSGLMERMAALERRVAVIEERLGIAPPAVDGSAFSAREAYHAYRERHAVPEPFRCRESTATGERCMRVAYTNGVCWQHGGQGVPHREVK